MASAQIPLRNSGTNRKVSGISFGKNGWFPRFRVTGHSLGVKGSSVQIRPARPNNSTTYEKRRIRLAQKPLRNVVFGLLVALAFCHPALASERRAEWNPPARFSHQFPGRVVLKQVPPAEVRRQCMLIGVRGLNDTQRGCANLSKDGTVGYIVTIDRPFYGTTPEAVKRHEMGHLVGWPADHPD